LIASAIIPQAFQSSPALQRMFVVCRTMGTGGKNELGC
jgi:hypothetical protein